MIILLAIFFKMIKMKRNKIITHLIPKQTLNNCYNKVKTKKRTKFSKFKKVFKQIKKSLIIFFINQQHNLPHI